MELRFKAPVPQLQVLRTVTVQVSFSIFQLQVLRGCAAVTRTAQCCTPHAVVVVIKAMSGSESECNNYIEN